ncbi:MAG: hypothetical protein MN733_22140 [Nitrososphaera sp.]|nr:hypothetical protein [Nitrososphaera sp.]
MDHKSGVLREASALYWDQIKRRAEDEKSVRNRLAGFRANVALETLKGDKKWLLLVGQIFVEDN